MFVQVVAINIVLHLSSTFHIFKAFKGRMLEVNNFEKIELHVWEISRYSNKFIGISLYVIVPEICFHIAPEDICLQ